MLGPGIFRDIEIAASASLYNLAEAIVEAIGFDFDHAFGFYSKLTGSPYGSPVKYELFADMGEGREDALSVKRTAVAAAYPKDKTKLLFLFDYGDNWRFKTERLASAPRTPRTRYPRLVGSRGEAPEQYPDPEDYEDEAP
jgi:hypothetical protein